LLDLSETFVPKILPEADAEGKMMPVVCVPVIEAVCGVRTALVKEKRLQME
jgi:hypothetical protein